MFTLIRRCVDRLNCLVTGHSQMLQFDPPRMFMRCADCGYESPGVKVEDESNRRRAALAAVAEWPRKPAA